MTRVPGWWIVVGAALVSCAEPPMATNRQYAVLTDADSSDWSMVTTGRDHTCALKRDGRAFCWGSNRYGQLGIGHADSVCASGGSKVQCSMVPVAVQIGVRFTTLSAGADHTCGITTAQDAWCWGANGDTQLGEFSFGQSDVQETQSVLGWAEIAAGETHTCALRVDGIVFCWGDNTMGQAGNGSASGPTSPVRAHIPVPVVDVSAGSGHTCARAANGDVYCWGALWTRSDSAGSDVLQAQPVPTLLAGAPALTALSVGGTESCGFDQTGFGYCWGGNTQGESGTGTLAGSVSPQRIASTIELVAISAGAAQACGIVASGAAYCWGDDTHGQLGAPDASVADRCTPAQLPCSTTPVVVFGRQQFTSLSTGFGAHTCGVTTRGNLYCWGNGSLGQLGNGTRRVAQSVPIKVAEPTQ